MDITTATTSPNVRCQQLQLARHTAQIGGIFFMCLQKRRRQRAMTTLAAELSTGKGRDVGYRWTTSIKMSVAVAFTASSARPTVP